MGAAGLWDKWRSPEGEIVESYTMLTINADEQPLLKNYHQSGKEKRTRDFLNPCPHDSLVAEALSRS